MVGKATIWCFEAIEKRHIAAALLLCPEDGARGLFRYLLFFFLLPKTTMTKTAPPMTRIRIIHNAGLLVWLSCGVVS